MRSIHKHWWTAALSAAALIAGCSNESADTTTTPTTTPTPTATAPAAPKADTPPELTPAVPKADDAAKDDMPKVEAPKIEPPKVEPPKADADKKADAVTLDADELAEIKKLPANEQPLALAQAVCPVTGEHLGGMGAPVKVSAEGKTFYLCCKTCKKDVDNDPKAVVAKLAGK